ncbi:hypothetical protein RRG08_061791 [Elysia crispata]|uniref:Uncharacterized protein n=1 Tax=Elysia crispata TaxID=231223 RepID=A0AAE0Y643_9GAST|nr:hypothetical protein RRG08_061791 [Elysia crispata]
MIWFAVVSLLVSAQLCASANPGVKVRLTKKGIDYANKVAKDLLNLNLKHIKIPDQSDRDGRFSFRTSHFRVRSLDIPHSSVRIKPDHTGLTWAIKDASLYLTIDYRALSEGWWDISNSGWIQVWASGINIHETVSFGLY